MKINAQWVNIPASIPVAVGLGLVMVILVFDVIMPAGMAVDALYIVVVMLAFFSPWKYYVYLTAVLVTALTAVGYFAAPESGHQSSAIFNHVMTGTAIWITAFIAVRMQHNLEKFYSERLKAEEQLSILSRAIEQCPVSIIITNLVGTIEYVNPRFSEVSGYSKDEVIGQNTRIFKSGEIPSDEYKSLWETITYGKEWRGIFHNMKNTGELYWESALISPVKNQDGVITHFLAIKE